MSKFNIIDWVKRLFGVDPVTSYEQQARAEFMSEAYMNAARTNLTAVFSGKLSTLTISESTAEVIGENRRAQMLNEAMQRVWIKGKKWTGLAFGTGGVLLIPYAAGGTLYTDIVPQDRMIINRVNGDELRAITVLADTTRMKNKLYYRFTNYDLADNGTLVITNKATNDNGAVFPLAELEEWAGIPEEMTISGVEHLPLAYIRSTIDNRRGEALYGVPVTFGCEEKIKEIVECLADIRSEYRLKKPMVGMDPVVFGTKDNKRYLPLTGLFMPVNAGGLDGAGKLWEVYDPAIRDSAYYNRLLHLYEELEKLVGTSRGILTEPTTRGATATEIKAGMYDTYSIVSDMRRNIEHGLERLAYAMDVLCNMYSLCPMGDYELSFDWSYSMIESSQESFNQLVTAARAGAVEAAEIRQYIMPDETLEEAQQRCAQIAEQQKANEDLTSLYLDQARDETSRENRI